MEMRKGEEATHNQQVREKSVSLTGGVPFYICVCSPEKMLLYSRKLTVASYFTVKSSAKQSSQCLWKYLDIVTDVLV